MNKRMKIFSALLFGGTLCLTATSVKVPNAGAEDLDAMIARLQAEVAGLDKLQEETGKGIEALETQYKDDLAKASVSGTDYDAKIAAAKARRQAEKIDVSTDAEIDLFASSDEKNKSDAESEKTTAPAAAKPEPEVKQAYPKERTPRYTAPQKNNIKKGRRPFTRSDNDKGNSELYFAGMSSSLTLSFAAEAEAEGTAYTGTTEEGVFLFSDNLANYCEIDAKTLDKMPECTAKMIKDKSAKTQSVKDNVMTMHAESLQDSTSNAVAEAAKFKNDSSGFEKNVLLPLQEKSSKATDERSDIEVLTLSDMEALKLKNRILQVYSTMLANDAFRAFGNFELSNRDMTDIDDEFNAQQGKTENK